MSFSDRVFWNHHSYGSAVRVRKRVLKSFLVVACVLTPGTNWLLPFLLPRIKSDFVFRYEGGFL